MYTALHSQGLRGDEMKTLENKFYSKVADNVMQFSSKYLIQSEKIQTCSISNKRHFMPMIFLFYGVVTTFLIIILKHVSDDPISGTRIIVCLNKND